ncbi:hypothetical protein N0V93_001912 [Gnomoniopsis smithogilvyi]|uniref:C4-dicarboxylate transporter/malic acid transport protein n=1 Tax=Gnomoniopsis smithogilvyi TaxID=1191159 RepID=A0A9W8Z6F3_9PEZI|nr:hypothetical protein N0V93_001912 [Gnomoniopsis smithogilvyi]
MADTSSVSTLSRRHLHKQAPINEDDEEAQNGTSHSAWNLSSIKPRGRVSIRDRLSHFTWAWFETTMATGAMAMLLSQQTFTFGGLETIGKLFFVVDLVLFVTFCGLITFRFITNPPALTRSLHHPHESFYFGAFWVSVDFVLYNTEIYGVPASGPWLVKALQISFWIYAACAILVVVFQYHVIFDEEELPVRDAMPAWILPAYPFLVLGPFAAALAGNQPTSSAIPIIIAGLLFNGLGWMIAFLMFGLYIARLVQHELPDAPKRPGMFVAVGPAAYTSYTLVSLGIQAENVLPDGFLGITRIPVGDVWKAVGVPAGSFFWLLSFWFFALAGVSVATAGKTRFTMQWWSFVFPQVALCTAGLTIGGALSSPAVEWVFTVFTIILVGVWIFVGLAHVRAVINKQILWPGMDENYEETD